MIHIDRKQVKAPKSLKSAKVRRATEALKQYFQSSTAASRQSTPPFKQLIWTAPDVKEALRELFHGKCAYCESHLEAVAPFDVEQFRPKWQALNRDGKTNFGGYWWLAYEWTNLYASCRMCNMAKGPRFPISGHQALPMSPAGSSAYTEEGPLLLDPCLDTPDDHLVFTEDGNVGSRTERGTVTIQVLNLNRSALVLARRETIAAARLRLTMLLAGKPSQADLQAIADDSRRYSAAVKQCMAVWLKEREAAWSSAPPTKQKAAPSIRKALVELSAVLPDLSTEVRQKGVEDFNVQQRAGDNYVVSDPSKDKYLSRSRWIERIEVNNFRPIEEISVAFAENEVTGGTGSGIEGVTRVGWLMLLGENSSGKSSLLQAVALTLIGQDWRNDLIARHNLNPDRFLRNGADSGDVRVYLSGTLEPIEMTFTRGSNTFNGGPKRAVVAVMAYGSTRLLPRPGMQPKASFDFARVDNLFNPFEPLNDASNWLAQLSAEEFDHVARTLKTILQRGSECVLSLENGKVVAELHGQKVPLEELSDGFQSVLALVTDIMRVMMKNGWKTMEQAEGIVLLDEIGSHLHPRWRMRVVESMRATFPRVQFLASTHDPLCLRGLVDGEVTVMRRDDDKRIEAITDLPSVSGLRVDQLLTSEYFGLASAIDPKLEDLFKDYYRLLSLPRRTTAQGDELDSIKRQLASMRVLGEDRRQRMMLETIDEFLARETRSTPNQRIKLKADTKRRLRRIWAQTAPTKVPTGA